MDGGIDRVLILLKDEETVNLATLDGRAPRVRPVTLIRHTTGFM